MRRVLLALILVLVAFPASLSAQSGDVVVFLVRHGEVESDGTSDPSLSEAGQERALLLARMLGDVGITHMHSPELTRTRQTGGPLAEATGLAIAPYDYRDLPGFAEELRGTPGRHLVLGHSNTTPEVVAALGGDPGTPIDESEFDRLYVVTLAADGTVTTVLLRYGAPFGG